MWSGARFLAWDPESLLIQGRERWVHVSGWAVWGPLRPVAESDFSLWASCSLIPSYSLNECHSLIHSFSLDSHEYLLSIYHVPSSKDTAVSKILGLVHMDLMDFFFLIYWSIFELQYWAYYCCATKKLSYICVYIYIQLYMHTHTHIHSFSYDFHYGLSQHTEYSSLCYIVGTCLSTLYTPFCIC